MIDDVPSSLQTLINSISATKPLSCLHPECIYTITEYDPKTITSTLFQTNTSVQTVDFVTFSETTYSTEIQSIYNTYYLTEITTITETCPASLCVFTETLYSPVITLTEIVESTISIVEFITETHVFVPEFTTTVLIETAATVTVDETIVKQSTLTNFTSTFTDVQQETITIKCDYCCLDD